MRSLVNKLCAFLSLSIFMIIAFSNIFIFNDIKSVKADGPVNEITVFSWEDYMELTEDEEGDVDTDLIDAFEEESGIKVNYITFATNEDMYNELKINPGSYDLMCPSEYMIQKMQLEDMIISQYLL